MKRLIYILLLLPVGISAQNMYNVAPIFENDLMGTARFLGMGGAMSALGADLSTISTNPAGIGLYRSGDVSLTGGLNIMNNTADYSDVKTSTNKISPFLSNASFVLSFNNDGDYIEYFNMGFSYRKNNNLNEEFEMFGFSDGFSQQYVMRQLYDAYGYNSFDYNDMSSEMYRDLYYSWLPLLAADAYLCDNTGNNFITYPEGDLVWAPDAMNYYQETRGGVDVVDFNASVNINDRVYLGATLGIANLDYTRYTSYSESDAQGPIYTLENNYFAKGTGVDFKLGAIIRPFKYSPFKIGFSAHTPMRYEIVEYYSAVITDPDGRHYDTSDGYCYGNEYVVPYNLATPWRLNASAAYTFGSYIALSAEYEYADYTTSQFITRSDVCDAQNDEIVYNMDKQHTLRVGAEGNFKGFSLRAGYNYITAPFKAGSYKELKNASVAETSTDYMNSYDKQIMTLGCGYRHKNFYIDLAYMNEIQDAEFAPFNDYDVPNPVATVKKTTHTAVATLGWRF